MPPPESGFWRKETEPESDHSAAIDKNIRSFISFLKKGNYNFAPELKAKVEAMVRENPPIESPDTDKYGEYIRELISQADKELTANKES